MRDAQVDASDPPARVVAFTSGGSTIARHEVDLATGALVGTTTYPSFGPGTSFLAFRPGGLVAVSESGDRVGAYRLDAEAIPTFINERTSEGEGPAHVAVDQTGAFALVANYGSGHIAVYPIAADGSLGASVQRLEAGPNAHQIITDPSNRFVFVPCLGADAVVQYRFDVATGALTPNGALATAAGAGPRHLVFTDDGRRAYLIHEKNSTLSALAFDASTGRLTELQTLSTRAAGATGDNSTAEVVVHPTGRWLYGSNRGDDNIVTYAIDPDGRLQLVGHTPTGGATPRSFAVEPGGRYLYAANLGSDRIDVLAIDPPTGLPASTGITVPFAEPSFVGLRAL